MIATAGAAPLVTPEVRHDAFRQLPTQGADSGGPVQSGPEFFGRPETELERYIRSTVGAPKGPVAAQQSYSLSTRIGEPVASIFAKIKTDGRNRGYPLARLVAQSDDGFTLAFPEEFIDRDARPLDAPRFVVRPDSFGFLSWARCRLGLGEERQSRVVSLEYKAAPSPGAGPGGGKPTAPDLGQDGRERLAPRLAKRPIGPGDELIGRVHEFFTDSCTGLIRSVPVSEHPFDEHWPE
ncbi:MAG: hypothetical protein GC150_01915 [Rhizobiales bacterium]|nr:hypothetical protein [Hyphomicrobiales bacterium]